MVGASLCTAMPVTAGALLKGGASVLRQSENQSCTASVLIMNSLLVCPAAGCSTQRRVDALRPDLGGDPRQPSRQRGGGGGGARGIEGEEEQRPPEQQLPPLSAPVFSVRVSLAVAFDASVHASIAQSIPY